MDLKELIINSEYYKLIQNDKNYINKEFDFPGKDEAIALDAEDADSNNYKIDINRKRVRLTRCTYLERHPVNNVLLRLDIDTKPHKNPNDGKKISGYHIHIYTDDYGDGIALELDDPLLNIINPNFDLDRFIIDEKEENRLYMYFEAFSDFCNIKDIPFYQHKLC